MLEMSSGKVMIINKKRAAVKEKRREGDANVLGNCLKNRKAEPKTATLMQLVKTNYMNHAKLTGKKTFKKQTLELALLHYQAITNSIKYSISV